ncbi:hypothetical protein LTR27_008713 [Elasticomyces elasticus]|nr:hypothetical protein LTR27_008713 [Elasticomyces elasticus]
MYGVAFHVCDEGSIQAAPESHPDSDPISIDVLRTACIAARQVCSLLWIDQLCILQDDVNDKAWQIRQMYTIYTSDSCQCCIVLPGGLSRLVAIDEETSWIHRAWTLQEAVSPLTRVLFQWRFGPGGGNGLTGGEIIFVESGQSAMMELGDLLEAATIGYFNSVAPILTENGCIRHDIKIFGCQSAPINALLGVIRLKDQDERDTAIWRSSLMRTSSRQVDMIFSIMGLFGVSLDPLRYGPTDQEQATLELVAQILASGRGLSWLLASPNGSSLSTMSSMPIFPETKVDGHAQYMTSEGPKKPWEVVQSRSWSVRSQVRGVMLGHGNPSGQISINAPGIGVRSVVENRFVEYSTYSGFDVEATIIFDPPEVLEDKAMIFAGSKGTKAILCGEVSYFNLPATAARASVYSSVIMLLTAEEDCWHKSGFALVRKETLASWQRETITLG